MKIAIDATNLKAGGGFTHLKNILNYIEGMNLTIEIIGGPWLNEIKGNEHIKIDIYDKIFTSLFKQERFKRDQLPNLLSKADVIFSPGGSFSSKKLNYVTMCRNMLVFEGKERN